jgi:nucleoside-diphosphate-sugar epimerase
VRLQGRWRVLVFDPEEPTAMRILILGGTGFIGSRVVALLTGGGHTVAVFHRGQTRPELPPGVEHITGDRDRLPEHAAELRRFAPEVVVHNIAYVADHARQLVEVFRGVAARVVVISSGDVYRSYGIFHGTESGPPEPVPAAEDAPLRKALYPYRALARGPDDWIYSYDKVPVEQEARRDPSLPATILRLPMVYGPGDPQHRLAGYLRRMADGRPAIPLDRTLAAWRCTRGFVEGVAVAVALAATDPRAAGSTYNVGEPDALTEADWVRAVGAAAGWSGRVVPVPRGPLPVPADFGQHLVTDTTRMRSELGYVEARPMAEALKETVSWELANLAGLPPIDYAAEDAALAARGG